jgi:Family of unknown function (DUF5681)
MSDSDGTVEETPRRYRNPPIEHRFRKGVSGNPRGRPRKERALIGTKIGGKTAIGFEDRLKSLAIEEAYRTIRIREAGRVEKIPVIQAILRKIAISAANGNARAQQTYLDLLIGAEADRRMASMELFTAAVEYKEHWGSILAERARKGTTGPEPVPHPDDIIIDQKTGEVRFDGPVLEQDKAAQEAFRAMWPKFERMLTETNAKLESDPNNPELRQHQRELKKFVGSLRDDALKQAMKRATRDALRPKPQKPKKGVKPNEDGLLEALSRHSRES